jgi:protein involved in polysaccharide export with SLBB domain
LIKWNQADNLAVFVDLPPYSTEEGVVLGEKLPNLVWCCRSGQSDLSETCAHMNTLKKSHRNLIGTVFNQARIRRRKSFKGWKWAAAVVFAAVFAAGGIHGQEPTNSPPDALQPVPGLSVSEGAQLAPWQERLTLGPGDVLDISLYGVADSARPGVVIGPDGRMNYLQARDVVASDLTVDELRTALELALAKYHLAPKVVINPMAYNSKKYYILGNVMRKGGYLLDRPTTIIEAIAKSGGFVSVLQNQNVAMLVDLERSFLVRKKDDGSFGKVPVNFEGLFQRGDLTQNVPLTPGDYLFFPEAGRQEVYVVGEVRTQGLFPFSKDLTALGVVAARGGFTERAWKSKILVIRGSLNNPQTFVIDGGDILKAKGKDFQLQNRDIVYVHRKPWAKAQEILEYGITSFFRAAVIGYTGRNVGPFITSPIIK